MPNYNREEQKNNLRRNMIHTDESDYYGESHVKEKKTVSVKVRIAIFVVLILIIVLVAALIMRRYYNYSDYDVVEQNELSEGSFVGIEKFGLNAIRYSHDGARYIDENGKDVWVDSYEMKSPSLYINGDYAVAADVKGSDIVIYDKTGRIGSTETLLPLTKAVISQNGVVAAVIEDNAASYITFFRKDGSSIDISIKSLLTGDGYPVDIALSPDGTQLIAAFEYMDGMQFSSKVVFYDFSEIGKSIPNRLVGGFEEDFKGCFIGRVRFINSTYSYAVSDTGISFFSSKNLSSPELIRQIKYDTEIEAVFNFKDGVGVILRNNDPEAPYKVMRYKDNGEQILEQTFNFDFRYVSADEDYVYMSSSSDALIMNKHGIVKYSGPLEEPSRIYKEGGLPGRFVATGVGAVTEYQFR